MSYRPTINPRIDVCRSRYKVAIDAEEGRRCREDNHGQDQEQPQGRELSEEAARGSSKMRSCGKCGGERQ
ncbi:hypothetical protein PIB30_062293 [Stylosanthes scabra]|uniref:Uncharacterized protein n=1 Tax=Stylosanthes scabra TaxID=79078 RepID=A0ABU6UKZ9_9FABA|nr:hypothetical protein [Stylosanthes scabra]